MRKINAVLFDMDGLLLDDERINIQCCCETARAWGFELDPTTVARAVMGTTRATVVSHYKRVLPAHVDARAFFEEKNKLLHRRFEENGFAPMKGAPELLRWLNEQGISCVLATSSSRELADKRLQLAGLDGMLQYYVTGDMVKNSKPHPEIFLKAAEIAGAAIETCLVLEDSYNGVRAGRAAGAVVGMVPDMVPYDETFAASVDYVFNSLLDVIDWMQEE